MLSLCEALGDYVSHPEIKPGQINVPAKQPFVGHPHMYEAHLWVMSELMAQASGKPRERQVRYVQKHTNRKLIDPQYPLGDDGAVFADLRSTQCAVCLRAVLVTRHEKYRRYVPKNVPIPRPAVGTDDYGRELCGDCAKGGA